MAAGSSYKARSPPACVISNYTSFSEWKEEFNIFIMATDFFTKGVRLPLQQARLFNLAGADFRQFAKQQMQKVNTTTIEAILDLVELALKPKRFNLQNRKNICIKTGN